MGERRVMLLGEICLIVALLKAMAELEKMPKVVAKSSGRKKMSNGYMAHYVWWFATDREHNGRQ